MDATRGECPFEVRRPVMLHRWETLAFLHWSYDVDDVQRLLPPGLRVDARDGRAWVGLVPFFMRVGAPGVRPVPWASRFCETNVRTYVVDEAGRSGIWFFSLDAARLGAVVTARATYRLPYYWSQMSLTRSDSTVEYRCRRRWPGPSGVTSDVRLTVGEPVTDADVTDDEHFLTARWTLFSVGRRGLSFAHAQHPPWALRRAEVQHVQDGLIAAAGLPAPVGPPIAHFSDGVDVRVGAPQHG